MAVAIGVYAYLIGLARREGEPPVAEMPDWDRRRFLGTSMVVVGTAAAAGILGRLLADGRTATPVGVVPEPASPAPEPPAGASLDVPGISPIVTPSTDFYRIDTALLLPRPDMDTWRLG